MSRLSKFKIVYNEFGGGCAMGIALSALYPYYRHKNAVGKFVFDRKNCSILHMLKKEVLDVWKLHISDETPEIYVKNPNVKLNYTIWTFWWQGMESIPENVQNCLKKMTHYADGHPLIVITKDNWKDYIDISDTILNKLDEGKITITHLSDIVRMKLLCMYGGLWLDAGVFPVKNIGTEWFKNQYYTRRVAPHCEANISDSMWCGSVTAGHSEFIFFRFMEFAFEQYWKAHDNLVDYFLIDFLTRLAYENIPEFRNTVNAVPYNNWDFFASERLLKEKYDNDVVENWKKNNSFLRLHWRDKYPESIDGYPTVYHELVHSI